MKKSSKTEIRTNGLLTDYQHRHRLSIGRLTYLTACLLRSSKQSKNSFPLSTLSCLLPRSSAEEHNSMVPPIACHPSQTDLYRLPKGAAPRALLQYGSLSRSPLLHGQQCFLPYYGSSPGDAAPARGCSCGGSS